MAAMLILLIVVNWQIQSWGSTQWYVVHTNLLTDSKVISGGQAHSHDVPISLYLLTKENHTLFIVSTVLG
jgi:hypothetical protein